MASMFALREVTEVATKAEAHHELRSFQAWSQATQLSRPDGGGGSSRGSMDREAFGDLVHGRPRPGKPPQAHELCLASSAGARVAARFARTGGDVGHPVAGCRLGQRDTPGVGSSRWADSGTPDGKFVAFVM